MSEIVYKVGQTIRQARTEAGISQTELAERMGISVSTVNKYENDRQNLTLQTVQKIATALKTKITIEFG